MKIEDTNTKAFDKLIDNSMQHLKTFEAEIRADERKKVLAELKEQGVLSMGYIDDREVKRR